MSQEEVADYLHISQSAYARMESGESNSWANHILKISEVYEINPEELLKIDLNRKEDSLSEKVIEQYEERIKDLKKVIKDLKKERNQ